MNGGNEKPGATWDIQLLWQNVWVTVAVWCGTRDEAYWQVGLWRQENRCGGDPFRVVPHTEE